jgi:hypothetical protein
MGCAGDYTQRQCDYFLFHDAYRRNSWTRALIEALTMRRIVDLNPQSASCFQRESGSVRFKRGQGPSRALKCAAPRGSAIAHQSITVSPHATAHENSKLGGLWASQIPFQQETGACFRRFFAVPAMSVGTALESIMPALDRPFT